MTPPESSRFLTIWFILHAILGAVSFFAGVSGPFVTFKLTWTVFTSAACTILAFSVMVVGARSRDPGLRRGLTTILLLVGVLQISAVIIHGAKKGGSWQTEVIAFVVICVICTPYVFFTLIKHEEGTEGAWWKSKLHPDQAQADSQRQ